MKKLILLTLVFSVLLLTSYAQSVTLLTTQKSSLTQKVNNLNDSIKFLDELIKRIQLIEVNHSHKISVVVTSRTQVGESDDDGGTLFLGYLNKGDSVKLYNLADEWYLARGNYLIGLIPKSSIEQTKSVEKYNKLVTKENKKKKKDDQKKATSISTKPTRSYSSGSSSSGGSKTIHTGPRGGKYYINSKGNKTYVKRKK